MPKASHIQTNLTAGEISEKIFGRVDVTKYENGAEQIQNWIVTPPGGAQRTPGTYYVGQTREATGTGRLIPFQFSTSQTYMMEFSDGKIRFYRNQGRIVETAVSITGITKASPGVVTAAAHGYSNGDSVVLSDIGGMTELNGREFKVANVAANTFELTDMQTDADIDTSGFTTYTSGGDSEKIYEITQPYADADLNDLHYAQTADVMYIVHQDYSPRKLTRTGHTAWTLTQLEPKDFTNGPYLPDNITAITMEPGATTGNTTLTASAAFFTEDMVGSLFNLNSGYCYVTAYTSTTVVDITVLSDFADTVARTDWLEGAWSDENGWPRCVQFYEQRLAFAGTTEEPQTAWLSQPEEYENFEEGSSDDDAITYTIATEQVNAVRWLSAEKVLLMGTSGGVFSVSSGTDEVPLTPTNVLVKRQTTYGCHTIAPKKIGTFNYYIQRDTLTMRELAFNLEKDSYEAGDITILSDHITGPGEGIIAMDYQQSPYNILWCVRDDGKLATLTRQIEQEVAGWTEQTTDGTYNSVAVIPAQTATEGDEVWFIVQRTVDGVTRGYVEYLKPFYWGTDDDDAFHVHSGLTYSGAAASTLTGLSHLEGETVDVYGDGAALDQAVVSDGAITVKDGGTTTTVTKAQVGLPYTSTIKTLRLEAGSAIGTAQGMFKRVNNVIVRVKDTLALKVGDTDSQHAQSISSVTTGDIEAHLDSGWDTKGQVIVKCDSPVPCHVLAIIKQLITEDR